MKTEVKFGPFAPWWRHGLVWMVWGGPALVIVASLVTMAFVIRHPDAALHAEVATAQQAPAEDGAGARQPALPARNHAAEGH